MFFSDVVFVRSEMLEQTIKMKIWTPCVCNALDIITDKKFKKIYSLSEFFNKEE